MNSLVEYSKASINLTRLYRYHHLRSITKYQTDKYDRTVERMTKICDKYMDQESIAKITDRIKAIKLEIRNATRGQANQEALDGESFAALDIDRAGQQLSNAEQVMLKTAYRKLCNIAHPDKGGNADLFHDIHTAYKHNDLLALQALYFQLHSGNDIFYQQSEKAVNKAHTDSIKPETKFQTLKSTTMYNVSRLHTIGRFDAASEILHNQVRLYEIALLTELQFLQRGNKNGSEEISSEIEIID